jgi:hypothetical protein
VTILVLVKDMSVSVWKCATFDILTWETHVVTLVNEWSKSQSLSCAPIDALLLLDRFLACLENFYDLGVEFAALFW